MSPHNNRTVTKTVGKVFEDKGCFIKVYYYSHILVLILSSVRTVTFCSLAYGAGRLPYRAFHTLLLGGQTGWGNFPASMSLRCLYFNLSLPVTAVCFRVAAWSFVENPDKAERCISYISLAAIKLRTNTTSFRVCLCLGFWRAKFITSGNK